MADMTITITVKANVGGVITTWTRTGTVTDIDAALFRSGEMQATTSFAPVGSVAGQGIGLYSESGLAVFVGVMKGNNSLTYFGCTNAADASIGRPMLFPGIPLLLYGGAGTGYVGAMATSGSGSDVPDEDLATVGSLVHAGHSSGYVFLAGLKPVS